MNFLDPNRKTRSTESHDCKPTTEPTAYLFLSITSELLRYQVFKANLRILFDCTHYTVNTIILWLGFCSYSSNISKSRLLSICSPFVSFAVFPLGRKREMKKSSVYKSSVALPFLLELGSLKKWISFTANEQNYNNINLIFLLSSHLINNCCCVLSREKAKTLIKSLEEEHFRT